MKMRTIPRLNIDPVDTTVAPDLRSLLLGASDTLVGDGALGGGFGTTTTGKGLTKGLGVGVGVGVGEGMGG